MWWRTAVILTLLVGLGAAAFFGVGPLTRLGWEDYVIRQLREQPSFKPQESPVRDVPPRTFSMRRAPLAAPTADAGRALYGVKCKVCHGDTGHGDGPVGKKLVTKVGDLTAPAVRTQPDSELFRTISQGKRAMQSFAGDLEDEEIHSLILFLRTLP